MFKLFEEGKKLGVTGRGYGVVVCGGFGHDIPPDFVIQRGGDEVGIFEFRSPDDLRMCSPHLNGAYTVRCDRANGVLDFVVAFHRAAGGRPAVFCQQRHASMCVLHADPRENLIMLRLPGEFHPDIVKNLRHAAILAALRTFCEKPVGYSLEPRPAMHRGDKQFAARRQTGVAQHVKERTVVWAEQAL